MRVVVDANPLFPLGPGLGPTGVGRWAEGSLRALARLAPDWQIDLVAFHMSGDVTLDTESYGPNVSFRIGRFPNRVYRKLRGVNALPPVEWLLGPLDAMLGPAYVTWRCSKAAELPVIHDLSYVRYPHSVSWQNLYFLRWNVPRMVRRAARLITVSTSVKTEIEDHFKIDGSRISVVPNGCDFERFSAPPPETPGGLPDRYLLFVGTREPRKNLSTILRAHSALAGERDDVPPLVVVGGPGWRGKEIEAELNLHKRSGRVVVLDYVPDSSLPAIYQGATALLFPSLYEGFGLPIVEAMAAGCPVLTSDRGAMAEVAGSAAVLVSPEDVASVAAGIDRLLRDGQLRDRLISDGKTRAASMSWTRSGEALKAAIEAAVESKRAAHSR